MLKPSIGLYIHVPYCRVICPYCDFVKKRTSGDAPERFVDALCAEISATDYTGDVGSIFFGGGTPSLLSDADVDRIFVTLNNSFSISDAEVSIEVNPDDVTRDRVQLWKRVGVNRLSLGVQSFDDGVLKFLGRCHDAGKAREACEILASEIENWSLDLIFGASDMELWEESLATALEFSPTHLSAYGLTYEENTPFWRQREDAIDDDIALEQYRLAHEVLGDYEHYEVSNFALAGRESAHNQLYWRNEAYLGFGPGAVSYMGDTRISNARSISGYERAPLSGRVYDELTPHEVKVETLIQHFRTKAGIAVGYYERRFGESIDVEFEGALRELVRRGLLTFEGGVYSPTPMGYELNNEIGLRLVGDD